MVASPRRSNGSRKFRRAKKSNGQKERDIRDVLSNPQNYPEWSKEAAEKEQDRLTLERHRLGGYPQEHIDPPGGLRRGFVPSSPWFDANWERSEAFPPGGDNSLMVRCRGCGGMTPPACIGSSGHCDDCRLCKMSEFRLSMLPKSTSTINLAKVKTAIRRGEQPQGGV